MEKHFSTCHIVCMKQVTHMVEMVFSQTACTKEFKNEDTHIASNCSGCQIQHVANKAFITESHPGQVTGFTALPHVSTPLMSSITPT